MTAKSTTVPALGAKPCPFCLSTDIHNWVSTDHGAQPAWSVMCFTCECEGPHVNDEHEAIRLWNQRPSAKKESSQFDVGDWLDTTTAAFCTFRKDLA